MRLILTPYADDHGPDSLTGWADYLTGRGDVTDETVITADALTEAGPVPVMVIYSADPPSCAITPQSAVAAAIRAVTGEAGPFQPDADLRADLRLDSLDLVEMMMEVEDLTGCDLTTVDVDDLRTVADVIAAVGEAGRDA